MGLQNFPPMKITAEQKLERQQQVLNEIRKLESKWDHLDSTGADTNHITRELVLLREELRNLEGGSPDVR